MIAFSIHHYFYFLSHWNEPKAWPKKGCCCGCCCWDKATCCWKYCGCCCCCWDKAATTALAWWYGVTCGYALWAACCWNRFACGKADENACCWPNTGCWLNACWVNTGCCWENACCKACCVSAGWVRAWARFVWDGLGDNGTCAWNSGGHGAHCCCTDPTGPHGGQGGHGGHGGQPGWGCGAHGLWRGWTLITLGWIIGFLGLKKIIKIYF